MAPDEQDVDARAWALKEICHSAWSTDPGAAIQAAEDLRALARRADAGPAAAVHALADWCDGIAHLVRGELAPAAAALDGAAARFNARGEPLQAAQTQVARVMALSLQGQFEAALACGGAAYRVFVASGDWRAAAKISLNLGSLSLHRDAYAEAAAHYRAAAVRFARIGDLEHSVMADIGLADALAYQGDNVEATLAYDRAAMRARTHGLPVLEASAGHGQALLALGCGQYADALAGLERARRAFATRGAQHLETEAEVTLADAYLELRLLPEALALYTKGTERLRSQDAAPTLAWSLARMAQALALRGDRAAALGTLAEAAALFESQRNDTGLAATALVRSQLHEAGGDAVQALELACQAQAALGVTGSAELIPLARLRVAESRLALGDAERAIADCDALLGDAGSARIRTRALATRAAAIGARQPAAARQALEAAIDAAEEVRAALPGDDLRRAYLADATRPFVQRLRLALDDAQADAEHIPDVLHWLERFKARALAERLGQARREPDRGRASGGPDTAALRTRLDRIYRRQRQHLESDDGESVQSLRDQALVLEATLLEQARRERLASAQDGRATERDAPMLAAALLNSLGQGSALLEFGIAGDEVFALVGLDGRWHLWRHLARADALTGAVRALRFQIDALRAGPALAAVHAPQLLGRVQRRLQDLHAMVWAPLAGIAGPARRVMVVPAGPLHGVPFAALCGAGGALVDRHEICYAANATVALAGLQREARAPARALLVGDGGRLPQVDVEIDTLARLFPDAECLQGADATVDALRRRAPGAGWLHLACHGEYRADSPLFSALHLADGVLSAWQVESIPLSAELVVLSACETALGEMGAGEEGVGLVRAFLIAGAARVMGSQWQVDDAGTADFMLRFHTAWRAGGSAAAALRRAQLEVRERLPHPFHWAAFTLQGGA